MKAARPFKMMLFLLLAALVATALLAAAGDQDNPEVTDSAEDSTTSRASHDVIKGWVDDDNNTLTLTLEMTNLDAFSPRDDWRDLPTTYYYFFFTVEGQDYAARASIPVHGIFAAFASFSLYEITYEGGDDFNGTNGTSITGRYVVNSHTIEFTVDKTDVGSPSPGDLVTHMWSAVYFQPRSGERDKVDTAMSYDSPGRSYTITGASSHYYSVTLRTKNATLQGKPRDTVAFNVTIESASTTDVEVAIQNDSLPEGYFINFSKQMPIPVPQGTSATVLVLVRIADNATNTTNLGLRIWGQYETEEGENRTTNELNLLVQVRFIPPREPDVDRGLFGVLLDYLSEYRWYVIIVIVLVIIAALALYFKDVKKRTDDDEILEYQAYLESQRQQREAGDE